MITRDEARVIIKKICKEHEKISLCVKGGVASWNGEADKKLFDHECWKHIGYVSALAYAFDLEEVKINGKKK